jgi:ribosomal protein L11 methyltransferase
LAKYPALDVAGVDGDWLLAEIDDCSPTAVDARDEGVSIFFATPSDRDRASAGIVRAWPGARIHPHDVDDEDWARRSQRSLGAVVVGALTVAPPWARPEGGNAGDTRVVIITPSMGFGTGHHATTRLCLTALQELPLAGRTLLDVGTGSGVLAIAGRILGASAATGIDSDPDAIQAATDNLADNPGASGVSFAVGDLRRIALERADVVTANLTGALLVTSAARLLGAVRPGGTLVVSGLLDTERDDVVRAFGPVRIAWESSDDGWSALAFNLGTTIDV